MEDPVLTAYYICASVITRLQWDEPKIQPHGIAFSEILFYECLHLETRMLKK